MSCVLIGDYQSFSRLKIPLFLEQDPAGFPSPAEDYVEQSLDLNELCIQHLAAKLLVRVQCESIIDAGISPAVPDKILMRLSQPRIEHSAGFGVGRRCLNHRLTDTGQRLTKLTELGGRWLHQIRLVIQQFAGSGRLPASPGSSSTSLLGQ